MAEEFRRWLRKLPCACCQQVGTLSDPIVAAHVDHAGGKGTGTKVADRHSLPLLDSCHKRQHTVGWPAFEKTLPGADAVMLSAVYWTEWPGRRDWERQQAALGEARA